MGDLETTTAERLSSSDNVSSRPFGRRAFLAGTAGAVAGATLLSGQAQAVEPGASFFEVVEQRRLCDTRSRPGAPAGFGYQRLGDKWIRIGITNQPGVPTDAVAAVLSVTAVSRGAGWNFVTVFPAGEPLPDTSSLNMSAFDGAVANLVTIKLGAGAVDLMSYVGCDLIVDLIGVYRPTAAPVRAGRLVAFPSAVRALDTRSGPQPGLGSISRVNLNGLVPSDATAVVGTLTAVTAGAAGYVTAFPRGSGVPDTSNLNVGAGETRAVGVITRIGAEGGAVGVDLYNFCGAHLLFDVVGYMTGATQSGTSSDGLFVPITPTRMLDTRREKMRSWHGGTKQFGLPAPINTRAQAIAMNLTVASTVDAGFFTVYAAQTPRREVSNLNVTGTGQTVANHAICRISNVGVACYSYGAAHIICDVMGWFTGSPEPAVIGPPDESSTTGWSDSVADQYPPPRRHALGVRRRRETCGRRRQHLALDGDGTRRSGRELGVVRSPHRARRAVPQPAPAAWRRRFDRAHSGPAPVPISDGRGVHHDQVRQRHPGGHSARRRRDRVDRCMHEDEPFADESRIPADQHVLAGRLGRPRLTAAWIT